MIKFGTTVVWAESGLIRARVTPSDKGVRVVIEHTTQRRDKGALLIGDQLFDQSFHVVLDHIYALLRNH